MAAPSAPTCLLSFVLKWYAVYCFTNMHNLISSWTRKSHRRVPENTASQWGEWKEIRPV